MNNAVGFEGYNNFSFMKHAGDRENEYRSDDVIRGIMYTGKNFSDKHITWETWHYPQQRKKNILLKTSLVSGTVDRWWRRFLAGFFYRWKTQQ